MYNREKKEVFQNQEEKEILDNMFKKKGQNIQQNHMKLEKE